MSKTRVDFHPVVPNITDDSMRGGDAAAADADAEVSHARNQAKARPQAVEKPPVGKGEGGAPPTASEGEGGGTWARRAVIAAMVVVIVVLVILLIYQVYRYYMSEPIDDAPVATRAAPAAEQAAPAAARAVAARLVGGGVEPHPVQGGKYGDIPTEIRNLDNSVLRQYVEKGGNSTTQRKAVDSRVLLRPRVVSHGNMVGDTATVCEVDEDEEEELLNGELECIEEILGGGGDDGGEDPPSREDAVSELAREMEEERGAAAAGGNAAGDDDIITNFEGGARQGVGGCEFMARTGKNKGSACGKRLVTATRCSIHRAR